MGGQSVAVAPSCGGLRCVLRGSGGRAAAGCEGFAAAAQRACKGACSSLLRPQVVSSELRLLWRQVWDRRNGGGAAAAAVSTGLGMLCCRAGRWHEWLWSCLQQLL